MAAVDPVAFQALVTEVTALSQLIRMPTQTQDQVNAGEFSFQQVRERLLYLGNKLEVSTDPSELTYDQIREYVKETAPKLPALTTRVGNIEGTLDPVLQRADAQLKQLSADTEAIKTQTTVEFQTIKDQVRDQLIVLRQGAQENSDKSEKVVRDAKEEFDKHTAQHDSLIVHARDKFDEIERKQDALVQEAQKKFAEIQSMFGKVESVSNMLNQMAESDVTAIRTKLAEKGLWEQGNPFNHRKNREISEYKAIGNLEKCVGDNKTQYKVWTRKFRNAIEQARGIEWSKALEKIQTHHVTDDFEELTSVDDRWDDWFEGQFGVNRVDGKTVVPLEEFKSDVKIFHCVRSTFSFEVMRLSPARPPSPTSPTRRRAPWPRCTYRPCTRT